MRLLRLAIPAAAMLLMVCAIGIFRITEIWDPWSRAAADDHSVNLNVAPAAVPAPAVGGTGENTVVHAGRGVPPFEVIVKPDQSLHDIAVQYLGGFDLQRLRQIRALNPKLTDPDHIEVGQKIWLPGPPPMPMAKSEVPPANVEKLQ